MRQLLKFKAVWCAPCKTLSNIMEGVDLGVDVVEIDVDENTEMAVKYGVRGVPTLVLLHDGIEMKRTSGVQTLEKLKQWLET